MGLPLSLQLLVLFKTTPDISQGGAVEQLFTAAIAVLVKVQVLGRAEKVAVRLLVVPSAGNCTLGKMCWVVELSEKKATVAEASPLNTKLPDVAGSV